MPKPFSSMPGPRSYPLLGTVPHYISGRYSRDSLHRTGMQEASSCLTYAHRRFEYSISPMHLTSLLKVSVKKATCRFRFGQVSWIWPSRARKRAAWHRHRMAIRPGGHQGLRWNRLEVLSVIKKILNKMNSLLVCQLENPNLHAVWVIWDTLYGTLVKIQVKIWDRD